MQLIQTKKQRNGKIMLMSRIYGKITILTYYSRVIFGGKDEFEKS